MGRRKRAAGIREDVVNLIRQLFPDDLLGMPELRECWFGEIHSKLNDELSRIPGTVLAYERDAHGHVRCTKDRERGDSLTGADHQRCTYHTFFAEITSEEFRYEAEGLQPDENGKLHRVTGTGSIGCVVAVSMRAPFAAVMFEELEDFGREGHSNPDIHPHMFELNGAIRDLDVHFGEMFEEKGVKALHALRSEIVAILESFGIVVLPEEELRKPVRWLRADKAILVDDSFGPRGTTVRDAFFSRGAS